MKIKTLLSLATAILATLFIACNDDTTSLGGNIQPDDDDILVGGETITLTAKTVSFKDSVYARTNNGLLGESIDPVFGTIKSDYLCEFFFPKKDENDPIKPFADKVISIDSVFFNTGFKSYYGDSISPMGLTVYEVTSPLKPFFFTSIDPKDYCDMTKVLGQSIFTIVNVPDTIDTGYRTIKTRLNLELGQRFYNEWQTNKETFSSSESLKEFFKGVYVTSTFGSGSMIQAAFSEMDIHYTYTGRNKDDTQDSIRTTISRFSVTPEVIQMNRIKNTFPDELFTQEDIKTYMKTPAGLYTELTIPLGEILNKIGRDKILNAANFTMKGFTEEEDKLDIQKPDYILLINKDSLENFFYDKKIHDGVTSFLIKRSTSATSSSIFNSYNFGNIASAINHYAEHYKNEAVIPDLKYLIIPVEPKEATSSSGTQIYTGIHNLMVPTSAILRTDPENMKMSIIYSKY